MQYQVDPTDLSPENGQKPVFLALWIIQKCIFLIFEWSNLCDIITKLLRTFSVVKICNMKSIRLTKLEKLTQNWKDHSKSSMSLTKKNVKNQEKFSRTCDFRGNFTESLNFHFKPSNILNKRLDFRQNPLKVEKPLKMAVFGTVSWLLNDPDFSREIRPCNFSSIIVF